jgi:hypothetical protein
MAAKERNDRKTVLNSELQTPREISETGRNGKAKNERKGRQNYAEDRIDR